MFTRIALLSLPCLAAQFNGVASSQTLSWTTVTDSVVIFGLSTEHGRPEAWRPYFVEGHADLDVVIDYDVEITNSAGSLIRTDLGFLTGTPHVTNTICWGSDGSGSSTPASVKKVAVPAGGSIRTTGSKLLFDYREYITLGSCSSSTDSIHVPDGASRVYSGPSHWSGIPASWYLEYYFAGGGFPLDDVDHGTTLTSYLTLTTEHLLPLAAGTNGCEPLAPNSTGATGDLSAYGEVNAVQASVVLQASSLPAGVLGYFVFSESTQPAAQASFGVSTLCLGAPTYRWLDSLGITSAVGDYGLPLPLDLPAIPGGVIQPGSTWHIQFFHRDVVAPGGAPTANSTNAISLGF